MHGCELKNAVNFIQRNGTCVRQERLGFYWEVLSLQIYVGQWEFVRLFVLSNSGDVSRFALFGATSINPSYTVYSLLLCCNVLSPYF